MAISEDIHFSNIYKLFGNSRLSPTTDSNIVSGPSGDELERFRILREREVKDPNTVYVFILYQVELVEAEFLEVEEIDYDFL